MNDGELLFLKTTANTEQNFMRERISDVMYSENPLDLITDVVMAQRVLLRKRLLDAESDEEREEAKVHFAELLRDFELAYLRGMKAMPDFERLSGIKAVSFLFWYTRYFKFLDMIENPASNYVENEYIFRFGRSNKTFKIQDFLLSDWDVLIYLLPDKPDFSWDVVEISDDTEIEETDWDGTKTKKGKEIIRRNGECGGKVFVFVYMEDVNNEGSGTKEKLFHFYSVSTDGREMRHYQTKQDFSDALSLDR
jgi:hypothetical protein